jgi:hypothetical protein
MYDKDKKILENKVIDNDFYKSLCGGICLVCKHKGYKSDGKFEKTGICMKKFWMDKRDKLSAKNPVSKCEWFESYI